MWCDEADGIFEFLTNKQDTVTRCLAPCLYVIEADGCGLSKTRCLNQKPKSARKGTIKSKLHFVFLALRGTEQRLRNAAVAEPESVRCDEEPERRDQGVCRQMCQAEASIE